MSAEGLPDVAFILINYYSESLTHRCIESILKQTRGVRFEIWVLDNHSNLDTAALKRLCPKVQILLSPKNLGFGLGNNIASASTQARYLFFLNNDSVLLNDAATILFQWMANSPEAVLCGPQLFGANLKPSVSFDYFPSLAFKLLGASLLRTLKIGRFPPKNGSLQSPTEVDVVTGAALFIQASIFHALGEFDPDFFLYCEEEDLAMRCWKSGRKVYYIPAAHIEHLGGGSSSNQNALKKEFYISFFRFYRKHYGRLLALLMKAFTAMQLTYRFLFRKNRALNAGLLAWFLRGTPENESLRYSPGNVDDASGEPRSWLKGIQKI